MPFSRISLTARFPRENGAKAIRTAGSNAETGNFVALLNFISWLTKSRVPRAHHTCETINKSSKSMIAI